MDHDAFLKLVGDSKVIGLDVDWYADQIEIGVVTTYRVMESKRDIHAEMLKASEDYKEYLSRMDVKDADT